MWRIIGVMNNIIDSDGNKDSRLKIIRVDDLGLFAWDTSPTKNNYNFYFDANNPININAGKG